MRIRSIAAATLVTGMMMFAQMFPFPGNPGAISCGSPVSGMQAWYAADNGPSCSGTCTNGATISSWADLSGNSHNGSTPGGGTAMIWSSSAINSLPAGGCNGSSSTCGFTLSSSIAEPAGHTWTIFVVTAHRASDNSQSAFTGCNSGCFTYYLNTPSGTQQKSQNIGIAFLGSGTAAPNNNWHQMNVRYTTSSGAYIYRLDRTADGSGTAAGTTTAAITDVFWSGANWVGNFEGGKNTAELIIYNTILGSTDLTTNETYLNCRYGL